MRIARARLLCRDLRHPWDLTATYLIKENLVERHLVCSRCGSERVEEVVRSTGAINKRSYAYADGYLEEPGDGRMSADAARAELLRHVTVRQLPAARRSA